MLEGRRIVLDPGHGGESEGAITEQYLEKNVNLEVALLLKKFLEEEGAIVFLTRDSDKTVPLKDRVAFAEAVGAEVFISIHHNASYSDVRNRVEVYYRWCDECPSQSLAQFLTDSLSRSLNIPSQKPFPATYTVLRNRLPLSVLTEAYYMQYHSPDLIEKEAKGILDGLREFFKHGYPVIRDVEVRENILELKVSGIWDSLISSAFMKNKRLLIEKKDGNALIHLTAGSGDVRIVLRNYAGIPSEPLEITINNIVDTYVMDVYPGIRNMPNLINIYFYDIYGFPIGDGQEVLVRVNGEEAMFQTINGRVSFVASIEAEEYTLEIEVQGRKFRERVPLARGKVNYVRVEGAWDGFAIGEKRTYPIFSDGSVFSLENKLKIVPRGFQTMDVEVDGRLEVRPEPLYGGAFHRKRFFIAFDGLKDLAWELSSVLWFAGGEARVEELEDTLTTLKKIINFDGDVLLVLKKSRDAFVGYYEMDSEGKRLADLIARRLGLFVVPMSEHLLIQPFGARVWISLSEGGQKVLSSLVNSIYEYFKSVNHEEA